MSVLDKYSLNLGYSYKQRAATRGHSVVAPDLVDDI